MRLVTGLAGLVAGMVFYVDLRECRWTSGESAMTLRAQNLRVRQLRNVLHGVGSVLGKRTVTGFTIYMRVLSGGLHGDNVAVAVFTGGVPGVNGLPCGNLSESVAAIMSVLAEAARNKISAESDEDENACYEDNGKTEQMLRVFESCHPEFCHPNSLG
jgi:hypothetical protein